MEIELLTWVELFWFNRVAIALGWEKFQICGMADVAVKVLAIAFTKII